MKLSSESLINILIVKSLAETVLVALVAVLFFVAAFPPYFHGWCEATGHYISGWAVNDANPWERVEVQLFIDNVFVGSAQANISRPDVVAARWSQDEWHGYQFAVPAIASGEHEARVYAMHTTQHGLKRTLQLLGDPIRFRKNEDGTLTELNDR